MPQMSGIYDSAWVQPIAKIKENLSIFTAAAWSHYRIRFVEPLPPGPASTVEMVALTGNTQIAANATIAKSVVAALQCNDLEFIHLRWEPLDNVEGVLWEQAGHARYLTRSLHCRVDPTTRLWDPHFVTTTFWVLGMNRDMNLEVRNPLPVAQPTARFRFWGYKYTLELIDLSKVPIEEKKQMDQGDQDTVRKYIGLTTWVPAEGI